MVRLLAAALAVVLLCLQPAGLARAHDQPPDHGCAIPVRPADDRDDARWNRFLDEVDRYRQCISDFADANYAAAEHHRQAAHAATLDWNSFVRGNLNVPQDYPWPPPERGRAP